MRVKVELRVLYGKYTILIIELRAVKVEQRQESLDL